ncbi:hypothetical protein SAMN02982985_02889 [Rugamonas rubra]|uniref:Uncharacterized protein n=2 Tax=Rugamonas rubra TaxID=758825 RepID=A0A1I4NEH3_9BURK|nr:hypothetical protein SAMN02982985_02889 [Rugamonas rubra]
MTAIAASLTALTACAASSIAMTAINASDVAMAALYAAPSIKKTTWAYGAIWSNVISVQAGPCLFVRLTTTGISPWGENTSGNEYVVFDGTNVNFAGRGANPYNHTSVASPMRVPMRKTLTNLQVRLHAPSEVAFIPLAS